MAIKFLLDTTLLIDHFNGVEEAGKFLDKHGPELALSAITVGEFLSGASDENADKQDLLVEEFPCLNVDFETAKLAGALRRTQRWKMPDAFQAALAIRHDLKLITRNTKDFDPKKHPFVHVPYKI